MYHSHAMDFSGFQLLFHPTFLRSRTLSPSHSDVEEVPVGEPIFSFLGLMALLRGICLYSMFVLLLKIGSLFTDSHKLKIES